MLFYTLSSYIERLILFNDTQILILCTISFPNKYFNLEGERGEEGRVGKRNQKTPVNSIKEKTLKRVSRKKV